MDEVPRVKKPSALTAMAEADGAAAHLFGFLQRWYAIDQRFEIDLRSIDSRHLDDAFAITAVAMWKLQGLFFAAKPGLLVPSDVVFCLIAEIETALFETFSRLDEAGRPQPTDLEKERFESHRAELAVARKAVLGAIGGNEGTFFYFE